VLAADPTLWPTVLGGGDDYELVIAVPLRRRAALQAAARATGIKVTRIGQFVRGKGVQLIVAGRPERIPRAGYVHF
jgi:thiamine-monophosphate kinase